MVRSSNATRCQGPLTDVQREELQHKIWGQVQCDLNRHISISGLISLIDYIDAAMTPTVIDLDSADDFGLGDGVKSQALEKLIKKHVAALLRAANELAVLMPDDESHSGFAQLVSQYPWLKNIAQFDGVVRDNWQCKADDDDPAAVLRNAVAGLQTLSKSPSGNKRGRRPNDGEVRQVVRAVCHFCYNSRWGLALTWPADKGAGTNVGKRGGLMTTLNDEQLGLPTKTAALLDAVFKALDWDVPRHRLRTHLLQYARLLRTRPDRSTLRADFQCHSVAVTRRES